MDRFAAVIYLSRGQHSAKYEHSEGVGGLAQTPVGVGRELNVSFCPGHHGCIRGQQKEREGPRKLEGQGHRHKHPVCAPSSS